MPKEFNLHTAVFGTPWAYDHDFHMDRMEPSSVVMETLRKDLIPKGSRVLDLGCGKNPRNAIYLAQFYHCTVDAVDLERPVFPSSVSAKTKKQIHFREGPVVTKRYGQEQYQAALFIRLIQYLPPEELDILFSKVGKALVSQGVAVLSYTAQGGILNKAATYDIRTYAHPLDDVLARLQKNHLTALSHKEGANRSTNVPHSGEPAVTFEIIAQKV